MAQPWQLLASLPLSHHVAQKTDLYTTKFTFCQIDCQIHFLVQLYIEGHKLHHITHSYHCLQLLQNNGYFHA